MYIIESKYFSFIGYKNVEIKLSDFLSKELVIFPERDSESIYSPVEKAYLKNGSLFSSLLSTTLWPKLKT